MTRPRVLPALLAAGLLWSLSAACGQAQQPPGQPGERVLTDVEMLMIGADANRIDVILHLLKKGVDVNARGKNGFTALMVAAGKGSLDAVELLLARGGDIDAANDEGWTALMEAVYRERVEIVTRLLRAGPNLEARESRDGLTALMIAAKSDKPGLVAALLKKGADASAASARRGITALHLALASTKQKSTEIAAELLVNGADPGKAAGDGFTPLMAAVESRELPKVTLIVSEKPDANAVMKDGNTALSLAARAGDARVVRRLIAAGARVTPATEGVTPLTEAARGGSAEIVRLLLGRGADANLPGGDGKTALIIAAQTGFDDMVRLLLDKGADANGRNPKDGTTALMWAANNGRKAIVEMLLERGANPALVAKDGWTAGEAARMAGHDEIARRLEERI